MAQRILVLLFGLFLLNSVGDIYAQENNAATESLAIIGDVGNGSDGPTITSIDPNPVKGSNSDQPITVNGAGFEERAFVILDDLEDDQGPFLNPEKTTFVSSEELTRQATFTGKASTWSAQVENPDGSRSETFQFGVQAPSDLNIEDFAYSVGDTQNVSEATFKGGEIQMTGGATIPKNISDASASAQITVEEPNSGTTWKVGREESIDWTTSGVSGDVFIWLYRGDGELVRRIYRWSGWGPAEWTVPPYIEPGNDYYIVIFSADDPDIRGRTDGTFTIEEGTGPYITMLSPSGGDKWTSGENEEIRWTSRNVQGEVEIRLYREGAILVDYISRGTSNDGTYDWTIPEDIEPRTDYYVGVRSLENESVWDTEGFFQIGYPNSDLSGIIDTRGNAWDVEVSGNYAFIADEDGGLTVADISNPSNPFEVSSVETPGRALTIDVVSNFAYVADENGGLRIFNITDPINPTEVGSFDTADEAWGITVSGDNAYIAVESDGLQILDISNPANPTEVSLTDTPGRAVNVQVRGNYAYVADYSGGLRIMDISDPANPVEVSFLSAHDEIWDIDFKGTHAFVADHGLRVIDISDPANPTEVSYFETSESAWDVTVSGNYAYIAAENAGIRTIDVSDPSNPVETGYFNTPDPAYGVSSEGEYVYIAAEESGVYIIRNQSDDDVTPPEVPTGLSALLENGEITLTWDANSETDLAEYRLYRFALPQKETKLVATISAGTETYTDTDIVNGRTYSYWVSSVDQNGNESGYSDEVQVTFDSIPIANSFAHPIGGGNKVLEEHLDPKTNPYYPNNPRQSSDINREPTGTGNFWFNLQDVGNFNTGIGGIHVGEDWNYGGPGDDIGEAVYAAAAGEIIDTRPLSDPASGSGYAIIIKHVLPSEEIYYSLYLHVVDASSANGEIVTPSISGIVEKGDMIARIGDVTSFGSHLHFEIRNDNDNWDPTGELFPNDIGTTAYYSHNQEPADQMTAAQVEQAYDLMQDIGIVDPSDFIDAHSSEEQTIAAPTGLTAATSNGNIELSWNANTEEDLAGYNLYRSTSSFSEQSSATKLNGSPITGTSYTDENVEAGATYYYRLTAVDADGNESGFSNEASNNYRKCSC
ncbi:MAG: Ser-Thr-rich GPI-anchored membrane family protein [Balneolaceae bacterium]|nr:Ser-Thr-rich GPI-anchored membrane family protein [Balneolaceae bacterium]